MAFGLDFFDIVPGLRLAGDSLAYAYKFTGKGGQLKGLKGLEIGLVDDPTVKLLEGSVSGYETVVDRDAAYQMLVDGGLTEIVPGLALGIDSLSSIETGDKAIRLAVAGQQPVLVFRNAAVQEVSKVGDGGYTWDLPENTFTALREAAEAYVSDLKTKVDELIAARLAGDGVLQGLINDQAVSDATARQALRDYVDAQIATDMWLFADQASFPAAADNHGRVVHSHADGALFYAHGGMWHQVAKEVDLQTSISSLASEASTREAADTALSDRLDVLEADPTTATAVAAGDTATLSSANSYTDTKVSDLVNGADAALDTLKEIGDALAQGDSDVTAALTAQITTEATARANADTGLSGRLDTLEADPTTQTLLDAETTARTSADTALDGRVSTLESNAAITDPTTATAVAAVQSDVDQNEADSDAADAALSGRLDVLEADPTTQAAVDLKAPLADPTFTGDVSFGSLGRVNPSGNELKFLNDAQSTGIVLGPKISLQSNSEVEIFGDVLIENGLTDAADDTAAAAAGVDVNQLYRNGSVVMIRVS